MHTFTEPHVYHSIREGRWCGNTDRRSEDLNPTNQNDERSPFALSERAKKKQGVSVRREGQGRGNTPQIVNAYSTQATVIKMMIVAPPNHRARSALCPNARKGNKEFPPRPPTPHHPQVCPATPSPTPRPATAGPQPLHCRHSSCHIPLLPCRPFAPTTRTLRGFGRFCYSRCCCTAQTDREKRSSLV